METNQNLLDTQLHVDAIGYTHLKETAKWAKLLAIVGFVGSALIVLAGLFAGTYLTTISGGIMSSAVVAVVYGFIGLVYFILSLYLFRFATKMSVALLSSDQENFNVSLHNQKLVYRIMGIIIVVYLAFLVLALIFGIGAAVFMS